MAAVAVNVCRAQHDKWGHRVMAGPAQGYTCCQTDACTCTACTCLPACLRHYCHTSGQSVHKHRGFEQGHQVRPPRSSVARLHGWAWHADCSQADITPHTAHPWEGQLLWCLCVATAAILQHTKGAQPPAGVGVSEGGGTAVVGGAALPPAPTHLASDALAADEVAGVGGT